MAAGGATASVAVMILCCRMKCRPRLIIVCGVPGERKTTHAKEVESALAAIRLSADEWMEELALDLWDEAKRATIEALQWKLGQQLLAAGQTIIIEWGAWARSEWDTVRNRRTSSRCRRRIALHLGASRCAFRTNPTAANGRSADHVGAGTAVGRDDRGANA